MKLTISLPHRLRLALPDDAAEIARLSAELGYPASTAEISERLAQLRERPEHRVFVAIGGNKQLLGWLAVERHLLLVYGTQVEIVGLVVDRGARCLGVGKALVTAAENWARDQGLQKIAVRSNAVRPDSHPFYERLGFQRVKTQHVYAKRLKPSQSRA